MSQWYTLEELKAKIAAGLDPYEFLNVLNISMFDLVERFEDLLEDNYEELIAELGEEPFFMKKTSQYNTTNSEPKSTSKKYIKRVYETKEAEDEIAQYDIARYEVENNLSPHELEERFREE